MSQHKGVQSGRPLHTNVVAGRFDNVRQEAGAPADEQLRISYGEIVEVDEGTLRVRVNIYNRRGKSTRLGATQAQEKGIFIPILQPLSLIHHLYGSLRKGLTVRVFWRGKNAPASEAVADIVSDLSIVELLSGSQSPRSNELTTGPHDIFTGGVNV